MTKGIRICQFACVYRALYIHVIICFVVSTAIVLKQFRMLLFNFFQDLIHFSLFFVRQPVIGTIYFVIAFIFIILKLHVVMG